MQASYILVGVHINSISKDGSGYYASILDIMHSGYYVLFSKDGSGYYVYFIVTADFVGLRGYTDNF